MEMHVSIRNAVGVASSYLSTPKQVHVPVRLEANVSRPLASVRVLMSLRETSVRMPRAVLVVAAVTWAKDAVTSNQANVIAMRAGTEGAAPRRSAQDQQ